MEAPDYQKIIDLLTDGKGKWNATMKNPHESIARGALTEPAKVWFYFLCSVMLPSKHLCTVREKEAVLLYVILKGYKFSVGKIIENSIMSYYRRIQMADSLPNTNFKTLHLGWCPRRMGRRGELPQDITPDINRNHQGA